MLFVVTSPIFIESDFETLPQGRRQGVASPTLVQPAFMAEMQMREMAVCAREIECNRSASFAGAAADFSQTELKALREIDTHAMLITRNRVADRFADRVHEAGNFEPRLTRVHIDIEQDRTKQRVVLGWAHRAENRPHGGHFFGFLS